MSTTDSHLCHWPWERLRRLRDELGFTEEQTRPPGHKLIKT